MPLNKCYCIPIAFSWPLNDHEKLQDMGEECEGWIGWEIAVCLEVYQTLKDFDGTGDESSLQVTVKRCDIVRQHVDIVWRTMEGKGVAKIQ